MAWKKKIVAFVLFSLFALSLIFGGLVYWFGKDRLENGDGQLRVQKKGFYTYVFSEEMGEEKYLSGKVTSLDNDSFLLKNDESDRQIRVNLLPGAKIFYWSKDEAIYLADQSEVILGSQVLVSGISERGENEIEASRITVLK